MRASDAVRVAEAWLVVLVGDLESFELFGVAVLVHPVVPEPDVHVFSWIQAPPASRIPSTGNFAET